MVLSIWLNCTTDLEYVLLSREKLFILNLKWKNPKRSAQHITRNTDDYHLKLKNARVLEETIFVGIAWSRV